VTRKTVATMIGHAADQFPIPKLPAFAELCGPGGLSKSERFTPEILSLPIYPGITLQQQQRVADALVRAIRP
jgi:dTDP-4-amino-4,6-dideoxygalactose transaminase